MTCERVEPVEPGPYPDVNVKDWSIFEAIISAWNRTEAK
jgi:hypothetical protein